MKVVYQGTYGLLHLKSARIVCECFECRRSPHNDRAMSPAQFERHIAGPKYCSNNWRVSLRVPTGSQPDIPTRGQGLQLGKWLEKHGLDLDCVVDGGGGGGGGGSKKSAATPSARTPVPWSAPTTKSGYTQAKKAAAPATKINNNQQQQQQQHQEAMNKGDKAADMKSYTPWRDANEGKFTPINVRWSGERCVVCDADTDYDYDQLIMCDMCGVTVHQSCYGVQELPGIEEMWLCRACELREDGRRPPQCCLCPVAGGALKPTTLGGIWCHAACLQWIPEVTVDDVDAMEPISGIRSIPKDRWELLCSLCKQRMGAKIQCQDCYTAYHPLCARIAGFRMDIVEDGGGEGKDQEATVTCYSYCGRHRPPAPHLSGVRKVEEIETGGDLPDAFEEPALWNSQPYQLPPAMPRPKCPQGMSARLMGLGGAWVRRQHGTGAGATTEEGYWIPQRSVHSTSKNMNHGEGGGATDVEAHAWGGEKKRKRENVDDDDDGVADVMAALLTAAVVAPALDGEELLVAEEEDEEEEGANGDGDGEKGQKKALEGAGDGVIAVANAVVEDDKAQGEQEKEEPQPDPLLFFFSNSAGENGMEELGDDEDDDEGPSPAKLPTVMEEHTNTCAAEPAQENGHPPINGNTNNDTPQQEPEQKPSIIDGRSHDQLVGAWIRVWWPEDREWYVASVKEYSQHKRSFRVWYDLDKEAEWIDLDREWRNGRLQVISASLGDDPGGWPAPPPPLSPPPSPPPAHDGNGNGNGHRKQDTSTVEVITIKDEEGIEKGKGVEEVEVIEAVDEEEEKKGRGAAEESTAIIGRRVGVWREEEDQLACGTIRSYRPGRGYMILFQNGDVDWWDTKAMDEMNWVEDRTGCFLGVNDATSKKMAINGVVIDGIGGGGNANETKGDLQQREQQHKEGSKSRMGLNIPKSLAVVCNGMQGTYYLDKSIVVVLKTGKTVSPTEFERLSGRATTKKWKSSIRVDKGGGTPGITMEAWLIAMGVDEERPRSRRRPRGTLGLRARGERRRQAVSPTDAFNASPTSGAPASKWRVGHRQGCMCVICRQSRRAGKAWAGMDQPTTSANNDNNNNNNGNNNSKGGVQASEDVHSPGSIRSGKVAYVEALPHLITSGPRPTRQLYETPPSRCWTPVDWAAHRLGYLLARDAEKNGETAGSIHAHALTPTVVVVGGSSAVVENNMAATVSLGPGATGGQGRTLTLKEKLRLCNLTEHERLSFGKSGIHGWGLFAKVSIPQDSMVVEFRGELVRRSVADGREAKYSAEGTDCYIFNLDDDVVLDATRSGTIARFTNHSCRPSMYTKILSMDGQLRLAFFARVDIAPGQELTYNYRFKASEEGEERMPCTCGAPQCTGYLD